MIVQKTLFGEEIVVEYVGLNYNGDEIIIPNFQPLLVDDNPRLDEENHLTKRNNKSHE